ncbi:MAG: Dps family protein [Rhodoplanes sp.]
MVMADARRSSDETRNSSTKADVAERLGTVLASTYALRIKTQNFHWNITGPNFIGLHTLLETHYKELDEAIDVVAERIRALDAVAPGSFAAFAEMSHIKDAPAEPPAEKIMLETLVSDHVAVSELCTELSTFADDAEDHATADIMNGRIEAHDKAAWMLRSHLANG